MSHYRYDPSDPDEPWWSLVPDSSDRRRHNRARRLSRFRRGVARGPGVMLSPALIAYRQACLIRWRDYLDGWAPPMPDRDNRRPPTLR